MTAAEIVGTLLTALLLGTLNGALLARAWKERRRRVRGLLEHQVIAYRDWLAAQKVLTRTSLAFVTAYRALASTSAETSSHDLKRQMFLQTRESWNDAMSELDRADASLVVWCDESGARQELSEMTRSAKHIVQIVLQREIENLDVLADELRARDEQAVAFVRSVTQEIRARHDGLVHILDRLMTTIRSVLNRWLGTR